MSELIRRLHPDHKWTRAEALLHGQQPDASDDAASKAAVAMLRGKRRTRNSQYSPADIKLARAIHRSNTVERWYLDGLLLTDLEVPEIVEKMGRERSVIAAYIALFFNVRNDDGSLKANDWLLRYAVMEHMKGQNLFDPPEWILWRYFALAEGVTALDLMVDNYVGTPAPDATQRAIGVAMAKLRFSSFCASPANETAAARFKEHSAQLLALKKCVEDNPEASRAAMLCLARIQIQNTLQPFVEVPPRRAKANAEPKLINEPEQNKRKQNRKSNEGSFDVNFEA